MDWRPLLKNGDTNYREWCRKVQSLSYVFKQEVDSIYLVKILISCLLLEGSRHPQLLKKHLQGKYIFGDYVNLMIGY